MKKLLLIVLMPLVAGCGIVAPSVRSEGKLSHLRIGYGKMNVQGLIGEPDSVRASAKLENGSTLRLEEYYLYGPYIPAAQFGLGIVTLGIGWFIPNKRWAQPYWLEYVDGKLQKWGKAGDWQPDVSVDLTTRNR